MVVAYGRLDDLAGDPEGHCLAQGCLLGLEPPGLCAPLVSLPDASCGLGRCLRDCPQACGARFCYLLALPRVAKRLR